MCVVVLLSGGEIEELAGKLFVVWGGIVYSSRGGGSSLHGRCEFARGQPALVFLVSPFGKEVEEFA